MGGLLIRVKIGDLGKEHDPDRNPGIEPLTVVGNGQEAIGPHQMAEQARLTVNRPGQGQIVIMGIGQAYPYIVFSADGGNDLLAGFSLYAL